MIAKSSGTRNHKFSRQDLEELSHEQSTDSIKMSTGSIKQLLNQQSGKSLTESEKKLKVPQYPASAVVDRKKKNAFGLDFEIPDELQHMISVDLKTKK